MWREPKEGYNKDGKARYCERVKDPLTGKDVVKSQTIKKDTPQGRKEAIYKLNKKIESVLKNDIQKKSISFFELCDLYLNYKKKLITTTDVDTKSHIGKITEQRYIVLKTFVKKVKEYTFDFPINNFNYIIYNKLIECDKISISHHSIINQIINFAYKQELIKSKAFLISYKTGIKDVKDKYLEYDELLELMNLNLPKDIELSINILLETGIRIGEFIALDIDDIKAEKYNDRIIYSISITKTYSKTLKKIVNNTKNKKSREIGINEKTYNNLILFFSLTNKTKHDLNYGYGYYHIYRELKKIKLSTGKKITPHIFRHTCASLLAEKGLSLQSISNRLGDTSEVIEKIYIHVTKSRKNKEIILYNDISIV